MEERKTGLVLEGGGMRGIYSAGVLDVFMEEGLEFDGVIGVSAGAVHGSSFVARQKGRNIRYYKKYCADSRFISMRNLILTGNMVETKFCYHDIQNYLDPFDYDTFHNAKTDFYVTCTDVETGKPFYKQITDVKKEIDYVRGSGSLPFISQIVEVDGWKLLDGSCSDSVPVRAFRKMGYKKSVVVLTRQQGYVKAPEKVWPYLLKYRKYPELIKAAKLRHQVYNKTLKYIEKLEEAGEIFVFRPSQVPEIGRMERNPEKLQQLYDLGRKDARERLQELKTWLEV